MDELKEQQCETCGATLTELEMQIVLKRGGPVLCSEHMADEVSDDTDSLGANTEL
ncbi:MAG TPA: hypothetical protein VNT22_06215 [Baekduia sp.]|nr:hypothetical protein [Baekduia sp.]